MFYWCSRPIRYWFSSGFPWLPVSIGSSLGVVCLVLLVCIACCESRKRRPVPKSVSNVNYRWASHWSLNGVPEMRHCSQYDKAPVVRILFTRLFHEILAQHPITGEHKLNMWWTYESSWLQFYTCIFVIPFIQFIVLSSRHMKTLLCNV